MADKDVVKSRTSANSGNDIYTTKIGAIEMIKSDKGFRVVNTKPILDGKRYILNGTLTQLKDK